MKKGILFTMLAYFLFVGILTVSFGYQEQSKKMQQYLSDVNYLRKIYYIETDISDDFYDLIGMSADIGRDQNQAWLRLTNINIQDYAASFSTYRTYMKDVYSSLTNTQMNLTVNPEFMINSASNFTVDGTEVSISNLTGLDSITVHVNSEESLTLQSATEIRTVSDPSMVIVLYDNAGTVLSNRSNPTRFILENGGTERVISVDFVNDALVISRAQYTNITGLTANASLISLTYDNATNLELTTGHFETASFRGSRKRGPIVLAQG